MDTFCTKYAAKLANNSVLCANGECTLWNKATNQSGYGVIKCKTPNQGWKTLLVHRLSFMIMHQMDIDDIAGSHVSHLCHNSLCTNNKHLSLEPTHINRHRDVCVNRQICTGHASFPDCMLQLKL